MIHCFVVALVHAANEGDGERVEVGGWSWVGWGGHRWKAKKELEEEDVGGGRSGESLGGLSQLGETEMDQMSCEKNCE